MGGNGVNLALAQEAVAAEVPDRVAIIHRDRRLTYAELTDRSRRLANLLLDHGVPVPVPRSALPLWESGQGHVAIVARNRPEWIEAMYGAFKARCIPFNVNYRYTATEMGVVLADAAPVCVIHEPDYADVVMACRDALPPSCLVLELGEEYEKALASASPERPDVEWDGDDGYLLYTGGTTGAPKGVLWRQRDIWQSAVHSQRIQPYAQDDDVAAAAAAAVAGPTVMLPLPPFMHGASQWLSLAACNGGDTIVIQPNVDHLDAAEVWRTVEEHRVQAMLTIGDAFGRPLVAELQRHRYDTSSLALLVTGGTVTTAELKQAWVEAIPQLIVIDAAGASETGSLLRHLSTAAAVGSGVFTPGPNTTVVSEDRTRFLSPGDGEVGWVARFPPIPLGYLHDEEKTAATFPQVDGKRVTVPGDRARWLADGSIELLGRDSVTINTGGEKVYAEEVERVLLAHGGVRDALAVGRPHERWGNEVCALVVVDGDVDDSDLLAHCRETLAGYKVPKVFVRVDAVRRSPAGKPDYRWGRELAAAHD